MVTVDAIKKISETDQIPLQWVGMEKVILPIQLENVGVKTLMSGEFDIFVNLVNPSKGIHMSRLYELLSLATQRESIKFESLRTLLRELVRSQEGLSTEAKITMSIAMPVVVNTLKSEKQYFKSVPLQTVFILSANGETETEMKFRLEYSSTCPQSAALAHQLTVQEMQKHKLLTAEQLTNWYSQNGFVATPHAQRSELDLHVFVNKEFELSHFADLFIQLGAVLGTPTQGIVKRTDEQEFARLNANNLMFCEDAARKLVQFLGKTPAVKSGKGKVVHLESLHSHNAVSYFTF